MKTVTHLFFLFCCYSFYVKAKVPKPKCPELTESSYTENIPHETDCGRYYICQKSKRIELTCPSLLEFNSITRICDWPENANCSLEKKIRSRTQETEITRRPTKRAAECLDEDQHLPHETICNQYYRCVYGKKVLKICPDKMVFNSDLGNCDFRYNVNCGVLLIDADKRQSYENAPMENNDAIIEQEDRDYWEEFLNQNIDDYPDENDNINKASNECPINPDLYSELTLLPHEKKCNAYYKCTKGKKHLMYCPGIFQFNSKLSVCDWPMRVKCSRRTLMSTTTTETSVNVLQNNRCSRSECQDSTVYLPDPTNVRQFIRCENGREIIEDCPNELVFDVKLRVCNVAHLAETVDG